MTFISSINLTRLTLILFLPLIAALVGFLAAMERLELFIALILIGGFVLVVYKRPAYGFAVILLLAPLQGIVFITGVGTLVKGVAAIVGGVFILLLFTKRLNLRFDNTFIIMLVFFGWSFTSILWSSRVSFSEWMSLLMQGLLYILLINLVQSRQDLMLGIRGYIIGGSILAALMIRQTGSYLSRNSVIGLTDNVSQGINLSARLVGLSLIFVFFVYISGNRQRINTLLFIGAVSLFGYSILISLSRGSWYAVSLSFFTYFIVVLIYSKRRFLSIVKIFVPLLLGFLIFMWFSSSTLNPIGISRVMERAESAIYFTDDAGTRFVIWRTAINLIEESPVIGHGFAESRYLLGNQFILRSGVVGAHNAFVRIILEMGVVGLGLFLAIWISIGSRILVGLRDSESNTEVLGVAAAVFIYLLISSMVDDSLHRQYLWFGFALVTLITYYAKPVRPSLYNLK